MNEYGLETSVLDADGEESAMEGSTNVATDPRRKKRKRSSNYRQFHADDSPGKLKRWCERTSRRRLREKQDRDNVLEFEDILSSVAEEMRAAVSLLDQINNIAAWVSSGGVLRGVVHAGIIRNYVSLGRNGAWQVKWLLCLYSTYPCMSQNSGHQCPPDATLIHSTVSTVEVRNFIQSLH